MEVGRVSAKMKKILFFRSAKWSVIDLLVQQFDKEDEIYCLVQHSSVDKIKEKYPMIHCYVLSEDYFSYYNFLESIKEKMEFDEVYIPISGYQFNGLEEIYSIIEEINYQTLFLINGDGKIASCMKKEKQTLMDWLYNRRIYTEILFFRKIYKVKQKILRWKCEK